MDYPNLARKPIFPRWAWEVQIAVVSAKAYILRPSDPRIKGTTVKKISSLSVIIMLALIQVSAQDKAAQLKPGIMSPAEVKATAPTTYYYAGHAASVQLRNTVGFRTKSGKNVLAGMVDTSGYSTAIAQKYQGLFITEVKLSVGGTELAPGEYGFGFMGDKFVITNVAAEDLLAVDATSDAELKRPVPLKLAEADGGYRLYAGKKYVVLQAQ